MNCHICGLEIEGDDRATCISCGREFHFPWSVERDVPKCGEVWIHPVHCTLIFMCRECYDREFGSPVPKDEKKGY